MLFWYYNISIDSNCQSLGTILKERGRNNFPVKALRFRLDLVDLIEQTHRNSKLFRGVCELRSAKGSLKMRYINGEVIPSPFLYQPNR